MMTDEELLEILESGDPQALESELEKGCDPDRVLKGLTLLAHSAANGHRGLAELLLARGASVSVRNEDGSTALSAADPETTALLVDYGAKVVDEEGVKAPSCLHYAAYLGQVERLRILLSDKAEGKKCLLWLDPEGKTPLGNGVEANEGEIVELLLKAGADIHDNGITVDFNRPLSLAKDYGHAQIQRLLEDWESGLNKLL